MLRPFVSAILTHYFRLYTPTTCKLCCSYIQEYLHPSHLVLRPFLPLLVHYQVLYHSALQL